MNTLRQVTSGSDILNAKRSNGKPVVANKAAVDTDAVNTAADVISKLPQFRTQGQSGSTQGSIIVLGNAGKEALEWLVTDEGQETTPSLLGDNIESMEQYVKVKVQAVMKVVGPVVKFVVKISGKVFRFLVDTTKAALECVGRFLEEALGIDLSALRDWFKHLFGRVDSTQAVSNFRCTSLPKTSLTKPSPGAQEYDYPWHKRNSADSPS